MPFRQARPHSGLRVACKDGGLRLRLSFSPVLPQAMTACQRGAPVISPIILVNWSIFEMPLADMEWTKSLLNVLERSRNIVMHGGMLSLPDIERIGGNVRDWVRQGVDLLVN